MTPEYPHGTYHRYKMGKCHCQPCRTANTTYQKNYMHGNPEQRRKAADRHHVRKGRMLRSTGPSGPFYWPGLYAAVPAEHRRLVRAEIEEANRRAKECDERNADREVQDHEAAATGPAKVHLAARG